MFYLYIGQVGEGKTISVIDKAKEFYDNGYTIYSNIKLGFPYTKLTRKMILDFEKAEVILPDKTLFLIDEIGAWFDSRNSGNSNNKVLSYFFSQLRKFTKDKQNGLTILGTAQEFFLIDIRGRYRVHTVIECKKVEEVKDEYVIIYHKWMKNNNLMLTCVKKELIKFTQSDFDLYNSQEQIIAERN